MKHHLAKAALMLCALTLSAADAAASSDEIYGKDGPAAAEQAGEPGIMAQKVKVTAGSKTFEAVWYDTPLSREVLSSFPVTVSMSGYLGREYYGASPLHPQTRPEGQYHFKDGEITYCFENNTLAIFHHQTDRPNLGMAVVPIGRITGGLDEFLNMPQRIEVLFEVSN